MSSSDVFVPGKIHQLVAEAYNNTIGGEARVWGKKQPMSLLTTKKVERKSVPVKRTREQQKAARATMKYLNENFGVQKKKKQKESNTKKKKKQREKWHARTSEQVEADAKQHKDYLASLDQPERKKKRKIYNDRRPKEGGPNYKKRRPYTLLEKAARKEALAVKKRKLSHG